MSVKSYQKHKEKRNAKSKQYRIDNSQQIRRNNKKWQDQNRSSIRTKHKIWRDNNREKNIIKDRLYRERNKDKIELTKKRSYLNQHPLKNIWRGMISRCYNINDKNYCNYGGRGIRICDRWLGPDGFKYFVEDMYLTWKPSLTLDRFPDRNGNYELSNCRWATDEEQNNNTRKQLTYRLGISDDSLIYYPYGILTTIKEFADKTHMPLIVVKYRYAMFWEVSYILDNTIENRFYKYKDYTYTLMELSLIAQISFNLMRMRIMELRWSVVKAVETPVRSITRCEENSNAYC